MHPNQRFVALVILLGLTAAVRANKDIGWHRPGCHKVGYTRMVNIPNCIEFSITTNACRGFCTSFAVPSPRLTDGSDGEQVRKLTTSIPLPATRSKSANRSPGDFRSMLMMAAAAGAPGSLPGMLFPGPADVLGSGQLSDAAIDQMVQEHLFRQHSDFKPVTSVGQCCSIIESLDVPVEVECMGGKRVVTFKSATKCMCYHCRPD